MWNNLGVTPRNENSRIKIMDISIQFQHDGTFSQGASSLLQERQERLELGNVRTHEHALFGRDLNRLTVLSRRSKHLVFRTSGLEQELNDRLGTRDMIRRLNILHTLMNE